MLIAALVVGFVASLLVTRLAAAAGRSFQLVDVPNARSSHGVPTPRIGGIGVAVGTAAALILASGLSDSRLLLVIATAMAMGAVGLVDDLRPMPAIAKLGAQIFFAAVAVAGLQPIVVLELPGVVLSLPSPLSFAAAVLWIVAVCNAVNFMDGIDGLVGAYVVVAGVVGALLVSPGAPLFLGLAVAGAGFLVWNWHPASIFMGDSGSQFVGFLLGAGLLLAGDGVPIIPGVLLLGPLLIDTGNTLVDRAMRGRPLLSPHREHLYQRLADLRGHRRVATYYGFGGVIFGCAALMYRGSEDVTKAVIVAVAVVVIVLMGRQRRKTTAPR